MGTVLSKLHGKEVFSESVSPLRLLRGKLLKTIIEKYLLSLVFVGVCVNCIPPKWLSHPQELNSTIKQQALKTLNTPKSLLKAACKPHNSCLLKLLLTLLVPLSPLILSSHPSSLLSFLLFLLFHTLLIFLSVLLSLLVIFSSSLSLHLFLTSVPSLSFCDPETCA